MAYVQYISEIPFFLFVVLVFTGGIMAVKSRVVMHTLVGFAVAMMGIAGLYLYLGSVFLSVMQALIYVGVICIILIFGIMAGYTPVEVLKKEGSGKNTFLALSACLFVTGLLVYSIMITTWNPVGVKVGDINLLYLMETPIYHYSFAIVLVFFLFFIAISGSIILVKDGQKIYQGIKGTKQNKEPEEGIVP